MLEGWEPAAGLQYARAQRWCAGSLDASRAAAADPRRELLGLATSRQAGPHREADTAWANAVVAMGGPELSPSASSTPALVQPPAERDRAQVPFVQGDGAGWRSLLGESFGAGWEYAWEVANCESRMDERAVGQAGELGLFQLHPAGLLPAFYAVGYDDAFSAPQQIAFVAAYTAENGWWAWTCAR